MEDEFDAAKAAITARNPEPQSRMEKNLMVHSKLIPTDANLQGKKTLVEILSIIGMELLMEYNIHQFP